MRKLAVMVAVSMVISLAGCGSSESDGGKGSSSSGTPQTETQVKAQAEAQAEDDGPAPKTTGEFPEYHWTAAMSVAENTINYMMVENLLNSWMNGQGEGLRLTFTPEGSWAIQPNLRKQLSAVPLTSVQA